jgi:DNA topoisomerase I
VDRGEIRFVFRGKSGLEHEVVAHDRRVAAILRRCQEIPGQRLFQYLDHDGNVVPVHSHDVNDHLRRAAGADVTAKDFRTWVATVSAASGLAALAPPATAAEAKDGLQSVVAEVARELGNSPAVCRASYVHPLIVDLYTVGALPERWNATPRRRRLLTGDERRTLSVLRSAHPSRRRVTARTAA